ncbi:alpha/beta hydrolase [Haloferula sp. A504]|uniref:alpha/beta hydrolase n=1 Tax=Haloferula sp. A504 TaxID=3373601 RepID=UPI0031C0905A|nr:alpha/beta hydrolase [Verrucomicrobiaceae bacterium E54]
MLPQSRTAPLGQSRQREMMKAATTLAYFQTPEGPLHAHFFVPHDFHSGERRPTVIFFHGGFWDNLMPTQFVPQCLHFATRGAIAISVETRVQSVHGTGPLEALEDVRTLLAWLDEHAANFGIDTDRVVLVGTSGGAWLALQQALPKKDLPPITPRALALFSPLLDTTPKSIAARFPDAASARKLCPLRQARRKLPPILICHGKSDRVTPFKDARRFVKALRWRRNSVELLDFEKAEHSFFNFNVSDLHYELTLKAVDRFLVGQGLLEVDELAD